MFGPAQTIDYKKYQIKINYGELAFESCPKDLKDKKISQLSIEFIEELKRDGSKYIDCHDGSVFYLTSKMIEDGRAIFSMVHPWVYL